MEKYIKDLVEDTKAVAEHANSLSIRKSHSVEEREERVRGSRKR